MGVLGFFFFNIYLTQREGGREGNVSFDITCKLIIREIVDRMILLKEGARSDSNPSCQGDKLFKS